MKKIVILLSILVIFSTFSSCKRLQKTPENPKITLLNTCCMYLKDYFYDIPLDTETLKVIIDNCGEVLDSDIFNEYYEKSDFLKLAEKEKEYYIFSDIDENDEGFKDSYFCKLILLRLKALIVTRDYEAFSSDYLKYYKRFIGNIYTKEEFGESIVNDKKISLDAEQEKVLYSVATEAFEMCKTDIDKYMVLDEILFIETDKKLEKKVIDLRNELKNKMGEDFKTMRLTWNGFTE